MNSAAVRLDSQCEDSGLDKPPGLREALKTTTGRPDPARPDSPCTVCDMDPVNDEALERHDPVNDVTWISAKETPTAFLPVHKLAVVTQPYAVRPDSPCTDCDLDAEPPFHAAAPNILQPSCRLPVGGPMTRSRTRPQPDSPCSDFDVDAAELSLQEEAPNSNQQIRRVLAGTRKEPLWIDCDLDAAIFPEAVPNIVQPICRLPVVRESVLITPRSSSRERQAGRSPRPKPVAVARAFAHRLAFTSPCQVSGGDSQGPIFELPEQSDSAEASQVTADVDSPDAVSGRAEVRASAPTVFSARSGLGASELDIFDKPAGPQSYSESTNATDADVHDYMPMVRRGRLTFRPTSRPMLADPDLDPPDDDLDVEEGLLRECTGNVGDILSDPIQALESRGTLPSYLTTSTARFLDSAPEWNAPVMTDCEAKSIFQSSSAALEPAAGDVTLQVYSFAQWTQRSGLPIFHLGVEVYEEEHFYAAGGVDKVQPRSYSHQEHREAIRLGRTHRSRVDVLRLVQDMRQEWLPADYALLGNNCQDFAVAFCEALGVQDSIPREFTRFAKMSDVLPPAVITGIREADKRYSSVQTLLAAWGPQQIADAEGVGLIQSCPGRLGAITANVGLPPVMLPLETEATVTFF